VLISACSKRCFGGTGQRDLKRNLSGLAGANIT